MKRAITPLTALPERQEWRLWTKHGTPFRSGNLAQRLERDAPGVSKSILEGLDEILTGAARSSGGTAALASLH